MDRHIVYAGSIPLDTDLLHIQRYVMGSLGALAEAILGKGLLVDGLACTPGGGDYCVTIGPGSYTAPVAVDLQAFGSLPAEPAHILRTALLPDDTVLQLGPPPDAGHVACWLIQASIAEIDSAPVALPYWNAANPSVPFSGPDNSGAAQPTQRLLRVLVQAKPGSAQGAPGVPPAADVGWVGLYSVTTSFGKPAIEAGDIVPIAEAPVLRFKLPALPPGFTQQETFVADRVWVAPAGVRHIRVRAVGGGGGGGGGDGSFSGGGGGAGGYAEALLPVTPGQGYFVRVGSGGAGGAPGGTGGAGGASAFEASVAASGGQGGGSANPDSHGGLPGAGTDGTLLLFGGYGTDGANVAGVPAGNGGASAFGGGGRGADGGGIPAYGAAKGSGGGGGYGTQASGGGGADGLVIIEY